MATEQEHFQACRRFQEYYDSVLSKVGSKAPAPFPAKQSKHYRREFFTYIQTHVLCGNPPALSSSDARPSRRCH